MGTRPAHILISNIFLFFLHIKTEPKVIQKLLLALNSTVLGLEKSTLKYNFFLLKFQVYEKSVLCRFIKGGETIAQQLRSNRGLT